LSLEAENSKLQLKKELKMAKVYAILSGKGGVGKTTTAINLGICFNYLGEDVIIVDANLTTPNVGIHLGAPIVPITLNHVLNGQAKLEDAVYEHESGAKIIPASLSLKESEQIDYGRLADLTRKLKKITEHVFMDSAAGLSEEAKSAMNAADEIIIVTNPEMAAVTDALKTIKLAEEMNKPVIGVIITRYQGKKVDMSISNIRDMLEVPILGIIPEDDAIKESHVMKNAVIHTHPKSKAARNYISTSRRLLGENVKIKTAPQGIFSRFLNALGLR
jgi:septum site-determining protein MinD